MTHVKKMMAVVLAAVASVTVAAGCFKGGEAPAYEVKGEIVQLQVPGTEGAGERVVMIRHEAVPDFKNDKGEVIGMESMTMGFRAEESVSTEGLAEGDRVNFRFESRWNDGTPKFYLKEITQAGP